MLKMEVDRQRIEFSANIRWVRLLITHPLETATTLSKIMRSMNGPKPADHMGSAAVSLCLSSTECGRRFNVCRY